MLVLKWLTSLDGNWHNVLLFNSDTGAGDLHVNITSYTSLQIKGADSLAELPVPPSEINMNVQGTTCSVQALTY